MQEERVEGCLERIPDESAPSSSKLIAVTAIAFSLFQLYTAGFGIFPNIIQRAIHLGFVLFLLFGLYRWKRGAASPRIPIIDLVILGVIGVLTVFTVVSYDYIIMNPGNSNLIARVVAAIYLIFILEGIRRLLGWFFPVLLGVFIAYAFAGPYLPGIFMHRGFSLKIVLEQLYMGTYGYWGVVTGTSATIIATYVIFGALLLGTGGGKVFMDLANLVAGRATGGGAKVAVVASSLFGTINGTIAANVATTGAFTIPTMKRLGYRPEFAGAVEATASTGGQIMPPIMGAGAFIMAEILGVSYVSIALAATIPALLYYIACFAGVHYEAAKLGYRGIKGGAEAQVDLSLLKVISVLGPMVLLVTLLLQGYTPMRSAFWAIVVMLVLALVTCRSWGAVRELGKKVLGSLEAGGIGLITVGTMVIVSQIIVAVIGLTALGIRMSEAIMSLAGGSIFPGLLMAMVIVLILGMGVPTVAAYVLGAAVVGPALIQLGVQPLAAHLFIIYFAAISGITPPVCAGVYIAAAIAKSNWVKTAWIAMRLGVAGFVIPYVFVYNQSLLLKGSLFEILWNGGLAVVAVVFLAAALSGYMFNRMGLGIRLITLIGSIMVIFPSQVYVDLTGGLILAGVLIYFLLQRRSKLGVVAS